MGNEFINQRASDAGFASDYDYFLYDGRSEELVACINAWKYIIEHIFIGEITEESLASWMEYFADSDNYEYAVDDWFETITRK